MIQAFLKLRKEWDKFIADHPQLEALAISDHEYILLAQIVKVLNPFKVHTSSVLEECATLMSSLAIYWDINDLLDDIKESARDYTDINDGIQQAMMAGISKYTKYENKMDGQILHYVAHVLNPRLKTEWIKKQMDSESATAVIRDV
jgi:hypothetical protein